MRAFLLPAFGLAAGLSLADPALAQSSLGLNFAEAGFGVEAGQGEAAASGVALGDYRITGQHGVQLDLGLADRPGGVLGQIDMHLYLSPRPDRKYGFVVSLADVDGREATVAAAGIEAMVEVSPATFLTGRGLIGYARPGDVDFIAVSGGLARALNDNLAVFATLDLAEFDEAHLRANAWAARIGASWQPDRSGMEWFVALAADGLTGRDEAEGEVRAELGVTWRFGAGGGAARPVAERAFRVGQPLDPLLRRGLF